jgi:hypothetical protein
MYYMCICEFLETYHLPPSLFFSAAFLTYIICLAIGPFGAMTCAVIWVFLMAILNHFSECLKTFWGIPYSIVLTALFLVVFVVLRLTSKIKPGFNERENNKAHAYKETYVEYKMSGGQLQLVDKSNIFLEPGAQVKILSKDVTPAQLALLPPMVNRDLKLISLGVRFNDPVLEEDLFVLVEPENEKFAPFRISSQPDIRQCSLEFANVPDDCRFKIWFNKKKSTHIC